MDNLFLTLDKNLLKFIKSYNLIKSDENLQKIADDLLAYETNKNDESNKNLFEEIENELLEYSNILNHKNISYIIQSNCRKIPDKKIRIYMDGVFDIIHSGHFNAIRQGRKFGDILVVGVNSDADVEKAKGPTLMNVNERAALIYACKWVDEVVIDTPYTPTIKLLDSLNIDYCAHGDDPCINELGEDAYGEMKKNIRFKLFRRTEGISTTEIIGRLLMLSKEKSTNINYQNKEYFTSSKLLKLANEEYFDKGPVVSSFLTTGWRLKEFCNHKFPEENDKVVYIDGAFDILHIGHIETLKKAKELGNFLYVGVHDDTTVNKYRGKNYPILNLQERVLNLLALKYVDDVVIGAPWGISEDLIKSLNIKLVVQGSHCKFDKKGIEKFEKDDPYLVPKRMNIYQEINSEYDLTNDILVERLIKNREKYIKKYQNKSKKEEEYYAQKEFISEV